MVWPLIIAGATGVIGTALGEYVGASSKKEASIITSTTRTSQDVYHSPYETFSPQIQYAPQSSYAYQGATTIINSPNSTGSKLAASAASSPNQTGTWTQPQQYTPTSKTDNSTPSGIQGVDFTMIAIIAAVGLVGYAFFKR